MTTSTSTEPTAKAKSSPEVPDGLPDDLLAQHKRYSEYSIAVDPCQDDRATELKLGSLARPHMRAFHYSWWSFFIAFFVWFAIAPLLPEIKKTLSLSKADIWTTNIVAVSFDIFMRFVFGAICDKYGARIPMGVVLMLASIPVAMTGLVQTLNGLIVLRLFIGIAGSTFVMCQCWSTRMFTKEIVGTANALVGGWGNVGGGITQIIMGSCLFPLFRDVFYGDQDNASEMAWRTVCVVPAVVAFSTGVFIILTSEDCPHGNYTHLKKVGLMHEVSASASFRQGAVNFNTWLLYIQYGCCFGVELTMNNAAALFFNEEFGLSTEKAAAVASIFGFMNIFARGLGGFLSDKANAKMSLRGRILVQMVLLLLEGICIYIFANMKQLWAAIMMLTIFSIFVQGAEGSTYGIVPYVNPAAPGAVSGIVGAGGPSGAVIFGLGFRQLSTTNALYLMASAVVFSGLLSICIVIKGHQGLVFGREVINSGKKILVPEDGVVPPEESEKAAEKSDGEHSQEHEGDF